MLKGFDEQTRELTEFEAETLVPMIAEKLLLHKGKSKAISNDRLRDWLQIHAEAKTSEPRIRKMVEHIRQTHLLEGLIAGRFGYYIAENPDELKEWIEVMKARRNALNASIDAGVSSYKKMTGLKQPNQHTKGKLTVDQTATHQFLFQ